MRRLIPHRWWARVAVLVAAVFGVFDLITVLRPSYHYLGIDLCTMQTSRWGEVGVSLWKGALVLWREEGGFEFSLEPFGIEHRVWWVQASIGGGGSNGPWDQIYIPLYFAWLPMLGLVGFSMWRNRERGRPGACVHCGYDRTSLSNEAMCPECGKPKA